MKSINRIPHCFFNPATKLFETPTGNLTAQRYAEYVDGLIPAPIKRGYETLECGHRFSKQLKPKNNCTVCWTHYFAENPTFVVGIKKLIEDGKRDEVVGHFGSKYVKHVEKFIVAHDYLFSKQAMARVQIAA